MGRHEERKAWNHKLEVRYLPFMSFLINRVLRERSTPSLPPSLSHSYETLNGSESAEQNYRTPHRPAPAPPGRQQEVHKGAAEPPVKVVIEQTGVCAFSHAARNRQLTLRKPQGKNPACGQHSVLSYVFD